MRSSLSDGCHAERGNGACERHPSSDIVVSGFQAGVDVRDAFGTPAKPNVSLDHSIFFENLNGIAYDEVGACNPDSSSEDPECDDDEGFDERQWFEAGEGNVAVER